MDISELLAIEDIRRVKYRYLRAVDQKNWAELESVLTPDAVADYGTPAMGKPLKLEGRDTILKFMRDALGGTNITTFHFAGQPEIDVDGDTAAGTWAFEDTVIVKDHRLVIKGAAYYEERYVRDPGAGWRIAHIQYVRTFEMTHSLDDLPSLQLTTG
ncbi:nuclear transport factor 2 family protein [Actinocrispum sp. NPDC049592]|uniref:nuclear transport factor 2 family protein n=1 Tax=Actinocrispum sp. NPDC049592 TaxID=3154835 RepID=UPI003434DD7D